jgi:hypothetical protein
MADCSVTDESGDVELNHATRQAAKAFRETDLRRGAKGPTAALIAFLRSDKPLTRTDREMLADMLAGDLCRPPHRPARSWRQRRDDDLLSVDIRSRKNELVALGAVAGVAAGDAAEEYRGDPRARGRAAETLIRLAAYDPYRVLLREANTWQRQILMVSALSEDEAARKAAGWASLDHRAAGRSVDEIAVDLRRKGTPL